MAGSNTADRLRPLRLAAYMARSALRNRASVLLKMLMRLATAHGAWLRSIWTNHCWRKTLAPLAGSLSFLPDRATWSVRLRRSLIPMNDDDAAVLSKRLEGLLRPREEVLTDYQLAAKLSSRP